MQISEGAILTGKITGLTDFGAFVDLEGGKTGMIHISEVSTSYVKDIREFFTVGQDVKVCVVSVSPEGKISLSSKRVVEFENGTESDAEGANRERRQRSERRQAPRVWTGQQASSGSGEKQSFEDMMASFKKQSEEKLTDLNRYTGGESRRSGNRRGGR